MASLLLKELLEVEKTIDRINLKLEKAMATAQNFKDLLDAIDVETDRLAVKVLAGVEGSLDGYRRRPG